MNIEAYLDQFQRVTENPTLETMNWMMQKFQNPHKKYQVIHVAGTNGKGSVVEILNRVLLDQGYNVGKYISPHLCEFNERICVNDVPISNQEIEEIKKKLEPFIQEYNQTHQIPVKHFEVVTSIAFVYFARKKCNFVVLETGMGGTWDCTNIVQPILSIITSIGYDHMKLLGNTLTEIAKHKAGIIKQNSDTIFLECENKNENAKILKIIKEQCKKKNNQLHIVHRNQISHYAYDMNYQYFDYKKERHICTNLKGKVQIYNTAICLEAINVLNQKGYTLNENIYRKSFANVKHLGRFEILHESPIVIYDGAHNEPSIKNFARNINQYYSQKEKVYILAILKKKDYETIIKILAKDQRAYFYMTSGNIDGMYATKEELYQIGRQYIDKNRVKKMDLKEAVVDAVENHPNSVIGITGSFYIYQDIITMQVFKN